MRTKYAFAAVACRQKSIGVWQHGSRTRNPVRPSASMNDSANTVAMPVEPRSGGERAIFEATLDALRAGAEATLAVVIETSGSTYVRPGAMALFGPAAAQVGWLSGGCLEPEIARRAADASTHARIEWIEIDTREDEDLFAGSAVGCRGRLRLALLPLAALDAWAGVADAWLSRHATLHMTVSADGIVEARIDGITKTWRCIATSPPWSIEIREWHISLAPPPIVAVFGAGPETALLVPLLRSMGWLTRVIERRSRWFGAAAFADSHLDHSPQSALDTIGTQLDAALVMHHNFERDREALDALAAHPVPFIGLLGPNRRREDLFSVLASAQREALLPRLHSPIGLPFGGNGPEAIALSIAAQLQAWRHSE